VGDVWERSHGAGDTDDYEQAKSGEKKMSDPNKQLFDIN
jgi:hypothetical protein